MKTTQSISKIASALLAAQKNMDAVAKSQDNPYFKSKYADINMFLDIAKPALNEAGVLLMQPAGSDATGHFVETRVVHAESGEFMEVEPLRLVLSKQDMQNLGACITYARRFLLQSLMGMQAEDDDGETAVGRGQAPVAAPKATAKVVGTVALTPPVAAKPAPKQETKPVQVAKPVAPATKPVEPPKAVEVKKLDALEASKQEMAKLDKEQPVTQVKPSFHKSTTIAPTGKSGW